MTIKNSAVPYQCPMCCWSGHTGMMHDNETTGHLECPNCYVDFDETWEIVDACAD